MLTLLKIRNLALVDELVWELGPGLVGVTGETGAGKSVIVGALKLVLGERADKSLIRTGEDTCTVEAVFELRDASEIDAVLAEGGLESCEDGSLIVRRVVGQSANRQFVNDSPVTLNLLKRLGEHLVDLHGPHDHQSLLSTERQLSMLDAYAGCDGVLDAYRSTWRAWRDKENELEDLRQAESASTQELDLLRHQVSEIDAVGDVAREPLRGTRDVGAHVAEAGGHDTDVDVGDRVELLALPLRTVLARLGRGELRAGRVDTDGIDETAHQIRHGGSDPDQRVMPHRTFHARDLYDPHRHISELKVKTRDFR